MFCDHDTIPGERELNFRVRKQAEALRISAGMVTCGRRLAQLRQKAGLTQQAVAAHLGVAQQALAHCELGRLRLPVALVPKLAALFAVPTDVLLGVASAHPGKLGPHPKLQRQLERLSRLPKAQQQTVLAMLDGVLLQHG